MKKLLVVIPIMIIVMNSCQQTVNSAQDESFAQSPAPDYGEVLNKDSVKLVKTAHIKIKIADVEKGLKAVSALTRDAGGMIYSNSFRAEEAERNELPVSKDSLLVITNYTPNAFVQLRVPSDKLEAFLFSLADLGYYTNSSSLQIDDKSLGYLQNQLKTKNRAEVLSQAKSNGISMNAARQKIDVKDDMINQQIHNKAIDFDVKYSMLTLNLYQNTLVKKEMIANYNISQYNLPFVDRLGQALDAGWNAFLSLILVLANLWVFILLALIGLISYRRYYPAG